MTLSSGIVVTKIKGERITKYGLSEIGWIIFFSAHFHPGMQHLKLKNLRYGEIRGKIKILTTYNLFFPEFVADCQISVRNLQCLSENCKFAQLLN